MGTDNLFHKIRERKEQSFRRQLEWRKANDVILIICQGKRTEPNYLRGLKAALRIGNANFIILEAGQGHDSLSVVKAGIAEYEKEPSLYDRVYCVFDRDSDAQYANAVQLARNHPLAKRNVLFAANSVPCFEIWLLLHFEYTTHEYVRTGNRSACDNIVSDLKKAGRIPNYVKNHKGIYELVSDKTTTALRNSKMLHKHNIRVQSDNPSTRVQELVTYLQSIAPK